MPEQFPAPETPIADAGTKAKETIAEIREMNGKILALLRDWDHIQEGISKNDAEAGRHLLMKKVLSRIARLFSKKKPEPVRYDEKTRDDLQQTSWEMHAEVGRLTDIRDRLLDSLGPNERNEMRAEWAELDRIYKASHKEEKGE